MIERAWADAGRDPGSVRFSIMTGAALGRDRAEADERLRLARERSGLGAGLSYSFHGSPERVVEQLAAFRDAGVDRVMVQFLLHEDVEQIELLGRLASALE